jgi:thiol-disulfide isomerase/thioredoxin
LFLLFTEKSDAQNRQIPVLSFTEFEPLMQQQNDTLYVLNFWATWCRPCVAELPYFEKINADYADEKVKVILVSLDFSDNLDSRVIPFLEKRNIQSEVILLDESNPNSWIDKVSPDWSGAIPATLIYRNEKSEFYEQDFDYDELSDIIDNF